MIPIRDAAAQCVERVRRKRAIDAIGHLTMDEFEEIVVHEARRRVAREGGRRMVSNLGRLIERIGWKATPL